MNEGVFMDEHVKDQLDRIEKSVSEIERAIFGESKSGLNGLVQDMKEMKDFRAKQNLKAAGVAGAVSVAALFAKAIWGKLFP